MVNLGTVFVMALATGAVTMIVGYMIGKAKGKMYLKMAYDLADRTQKQAEVLRDAFMDVFESLAEEDDEQ
jgi:hypothetical protein